MKKNLFTLTCTLCLVTQLYGEIFIGTSLQYGTAEESDTSYAVKVYAQSSSLPALSVHAGIKNYSWVQEGISYNNLIIGADQTLDFQGVFAGLDFNLWANNYFFVDSSLSYIILSKVTFEDSVTSADVTFPSSAYDLELGIGTNYGSWTLRPFYSITKFDSDYVVLGKIMRTKQQQSFNLEFIYWW